MEPPQRRIGDLRASRRRQQPHRSVLGAVELQKEGAVGLGRKAPDEHRVDHRVERDVVRPRRAREQARVPEEHVVELVHHQQEQVLVRPAVPAHEHRVDAKHRSSLTRDRGRRHVIGLLDAQQRQQRVHLVGASRNRIQDARRQVVHRTPRVTAVALFVSTRRPVQTRIGVSRRTRWKEQRHVAWDDQRRLESAGQIQRPGSRGQDGDGCGAGQLLVAGPGRLLHEESEALRQLQVCDAPRRRPAATPPARAGSRRYLAIAARKASIVSPSSCAAAGPARRRHRPSGSSGSSAASSSPVDAHGGAPMRDAIAPSSGARPAARSAPNAAARSCCAVRSWRTEHLRGVVVGTLRAPPSGTARLPA